jgi:putative transposase
VPDHDLSHLRYQLLWASRRRRRFLEGEVLQRLAELMVEAADALGVKLTRIASGGDYVIVTVEAPPELAPVVIVRRLKRHAASRLRREFPELRALPSIWTRQFLATTRAEFPTDEVRGFVESQPRSERPKYQRPQAVPPDSTARSRVVVDQRRPSDPLVPDDASSTDRTS